MISLFLSPHSDDSVLYGAYTLMREKPLVLTVTTSFIQQNRGENITPQQRIEEDIKAMKILNCPIFFGNLRDDVLDEWAVKNLLIRFKNFDKVYAPAVQGGNKDHDLIGKVAQEFFPNLIQYSTYAKGEFYTPGKKEIKPTNEQISLKNIVLKCYKSQIKLPATKPHFKAVMKGKSEWTL